MKLRKRERIAVGLALAAVAALVVDRLVSDPGGGAGPATAQAGASPPSPRAATSSAAADGEARNSDDDQDAVLLEYDARAPTRDPFSLTPRLLAGFRRASEALAEEQVQRMAEETRTIDEFRVAHRLDAVLLSPDRPLVIVNGRELQLGESISGYELVAVEPLSATFQAGARQVQLYVPLIDR